MSKKETKKTKSEKIGYRIGKIHSTKFSFEDITDNRVQEIFKSPEQLGVNISVSMTIKKDDESIVIDINSALEDNKQKETLITHTGRTLYYLRGLTETYLPEKDSYNLSSDLLLQLLSIAYTHARALLATEVSPTCYHEKYFLPVIDPRNLLDMLESSIAKP